MKTIKYFFLLALGLFITSSCDTNDDGFYNTVYLNSINLVAIETQASYAVGDKLYVTADFSRYQNEAGYSEPLDIYKTTGGTETFNLSYSLERKNGANWEAVEIPSNQLDIIEGSALSGSFVYGSCLYNASSGNYKYNVGLPLSQAGEYRLIFDNDNNSNEAELISKSTGLDLILKIFTTVENQNSGNYTFTVN